MSAFVRKEYMARWFQKNKEALTKQNLKNANANKRRKKIRAMARLGSECQKCGYNKCIDALDFHHTNPDEKEIDIGHLLRRPWYIIEEQLNELILKGDIKLVCSNCHRAIHAGLRIYGNNKIQET